MNSTSIEDDAEKSFVNMMKIGVAISVIKNTPKHLTPEEYAKALYKEATQQSIKWKRKCETLESEVRVWKTKALKNDLSSATNEVVCSTPPCSSESDNGVAMQEDIFAAIRSLKQFSRILKDYYSNKNTIDDEIICGIDTMYKQDTVLNYLKTVFQFASQGVKSAKEGDREMVEVCVSSITDLLTTFPMYASTQRLHTVEMVTQCEALKLSEKIQEEIINQNKINATPLQHTRSSLITTMCKSRNLRCHISLQLSHNVFSVAEKIARENKEFHLHDNIFYLLQMLEKLLTLEIKHRTKDKQNEEMHTQMETQQISSTKKPQSSSDCPITVENDKQCDELLTKSFIICKQVILDSNYKNILIPTYLWSIICLFNKIFSL